MVRRTIMLAVCAGICLGGVQPAMAQDENPFDPEEARQEAQAERERRRQQAQRTEESKDGQSGQGSIKTTQTTTERGDLSNGPDWIKADAAVGCFNDKYVFRRSITSERKILVALDTKRVPSDVEVQFDCGEGE